MEQPETMRNFFNARADIYDTQQVRNIDGGSTCYRAAAKFLPANLEMLLDLGCGTGLELEAIFARFPGVQITGIDLAEKMLQKLREKYAGRNLHLINGSYFSTELGENRYDAAISIMSLHHFEPDIKVGLYRNIYRSLRSGGVFLEGDYMVGSNDNTVEMELLAERRKVQRDCRLTESFYHIDTPLTIKHEADLLVSAGFSAVHQVWGIGNNIMLLAEKAACATACPPL